MKVKILGSGTIIPEIKKNCSGYLVNDRLLLDCGPGIWKALVDNETDFNHLNHICISHFHADHVSDLQALLMSRWLLEQNRQIPLHIFGPVGLSRWFGILKQLHGQWISELEIHLVEMQSEKDYTLLDFNVRTGPNGHTENSLSWRVTERNGKALFYSADMDYDTRLLSLARGCLTGIIEASNTTETKVPGHLTPQLAAQFAAEANLRTLVLTHPYPEVLKMDRIAIAKKYFDGDVILAEDGLMLDIS